MADTKRVLTQRENNSAAEPHAVTQAGEAQHPSSLPVEENEESSGPTHEEIAARAYQCWQERGGLGGAPEEDWYRAEQELRKEHAKTRRPSRSAAASA